MFADLILVLRKRHIAAVPQHMNEFQLRQLSMQEWEQVYASGSFPTPTCLPPLACREMTSERIGMRHNCVFHGLTLINTAVFREFHGDQARYSENVEIPEITVTLQAHYEMEALGNASTRLKFNVNWMDSQLPAEKKRGMMAGQASNFELFKRVCENNPA